MKNNYFPGANEFYEKFCAAVTQSGNRESFTQKWGLERLEEIYDMLVDNIQGGYDSHKYTMLSAGTGGTVLNIGPGLGFCVFLLSELFDTVLVAEPDHENCVLLDGIARHYLTHNGKPAHEIVKIYPAGISITGEAVDYWNTKRMLMKKRNLKGSILNFTIQGAGELGNILTEKVDRVYLHKVLSSLSIAAPFETLVSGIREFIGKGGEITWSEPGYVFEDILQVEEPNTLEDVLQPIFEKNGLQFRLKSYQLAGINRETGQTNSETWRLIKARRKIDEER